VHVIDFRVHFLRSGTTEDVDAFVIPDPSLDLWTKTEKEAAAAAAQTDPAPSTLESEVRWTPRGRAAV